MLWWYCLKKKLKVYVIYAFFFDHFLKFRDDDEEVTKF